MSRVRDSSSKQKVLVQLMSSNPSLMDGLDDDLLASITLLSHPSKKWMEKPPTTLTRECNKIHATPIERQTIQLYPEDAAFVAKKKPPKVLTSSKAIRSGAKLSLPRETTVLLSPSSTATARAATVRSKQDHRKSTLETSMTCNATPANRRTFCPVMQQEPAASVILFDAGMLKEVDESTTERKYRRAPGKCGSTKKRSKRMRRLGRTRSSSENDRNTNSEDDSKASKGDKTAWDVSAMVHDSASFKSCSEEGMQAVSAISSSATCDTGLASRFLLDHHFASRNGRVLLSARNACYVCMREFNVLRKRHSCRMCGEVICRRCSVFRQVKTPLMETKIRICTCCFVAYRKQQKEEITQSEYKNELSTLEPGKDDCANHWELRNGSNQTLNSELPDPPASGTGSDQASQSLSPSDNTSDRSSSTINTMSDFSFSSDTINDANDFGSRTIEEELEAVLKAKQLEKAVEASQERIQALESQIATQESQQDLLSTEQQAQLQDARATIKLLQDQLCMQEVNARQAAYNRDSICRSKLRRTEVYTKEDDESDALKKKLRVLERQLKQAGISVAEVIPYKVAKTRVAEISKRLQELGSSDVMLDDKQAQAAARKEYYILEQEMEKYHMALVMTDEYIEEQRRQEQDWEDANHSANMKALCLLRSAIPVEIARLSERELIATVTPTGLKFPAELAKRLKRTNVLQLVRTDPQTIAKMHPSVIEGYRTTGLSLLERRALHAVMKEPVKEWKKQQTDGMAQRKYAWYCKLKDAFMTAAISLTNHHKDEAGENYRGVGFKHKCDLADSACPVRTEEKMQKLYSGLGFTTEAEYVTEVIVKSDPEGAGEKALLEAQGFVREMITTQRHKELKGHYKTNTREFAQALSALKEMDSILETVRSLDDSFLLSTDIETGGHQQLNQCELLLTSARELMHLLAKRARICVTGKRDFAYDNEDTRSPVETREAGRAIFFLEEILTDVEAFLVIEEGVFSKHKSVLAVATLKALRELMNDVRQKNSVALGNEDKISAVRKGSRVSWPKRKNQHALSNVQTLDIPLPAALPTSASMFDAIKARRKQNENLDKTKGHHDNQKESSTEISHISKPADLMTAIRARKRAMSNGPIENLLYS